MRNAEAEREQIVRELMQALEGLTSEEIPVFHNGRRLCPHCVRVHLEAMQRVGEVEAWSFRVNRYGRRQKVWHWVPAAWRTIYPNEAYL